MAELTNEIKEQIKKEGRLRSYPIRMPVRRL